MDQQQEPRDDPRATTEPSDEPSAGQMLRATLTVLLLDAGLAAGAYGIVRVAGGSVLVALVVGAVVSLARAGWVTARSGRVDLFAIFMVGIFTVGLALSLWSGSPRFLLVKESFGTGAAGLAFVLTCLRGRPLAFHASQRIAAPTPADREEWDRLWAGEPVFRRRFRVMSLVIGGALLAEALARVVLVFLVPADVVVGVSAVMVPAVLTAVSFWAVGYGRRNEAAIEASHRS